MNDPNGICCCKCLNSLKLSCELSGWSLLEFIFFCFLLWWIFYFFLLVVTKQSEEWCCRMLTFFHGCLISYHALTDAYVNKSRIDFKRIPLSASKKTYLSYMFSYFLFDFCWIHFFGNETKIIYAHHVASILIIFNILLRNIGSSGIAYGAAGLELTNPYLQLRWFLRTHGYQDTIFHKVVELWFVSLFSVIRIFGGTVLVYSAVYKSDMDFITKLSFIFIYGISMVLQWQIITFVKRKYILPGNRVLFIRSRVSISLYFQRRTLDRFEENYSEANQRLLSHKLISTDEDPCASVESSSNKQSSPRIESSSNIETAERKSSPSIGSSSNIQSSPRIESSSNLETAERKQSSPSVGSSSNKQSHGPLPTVDEENEAPLTEKSTEENTNPDDETEPK